METNGSPNGKSAQELRAEVKIAYRGIMKQIEDDVQKTSLPYTIILNGTPNQDKGKAVLFASSISPKKLGGSGQEQKVFLMITDHGLKECEATPELEKAVNARLDLQLKGKTFPEENIAQNYEGYEKGSFTIIDPDTNQRFAFNFIPEMPDPEDLGTAVIAGKNLTKDKLEKTREAQDKKEAADQLQNAENVKNVLSDVLNTPPAQ
jgi:hypothetical protein